MKTNSKQTRHRQAWETIGKRRAIIATILTILTSIAVAIPSQLDWFLTRVAQGQWQWPDAGKAIADTLLIEGLCWLAAILYADAIRHGGPVRLYRLAMLAFAGTAAWINYDHGVTVAPAVGVVSALGSLMGVGAWELYMHRQRHAATGMSMDELRLWALRWRKHPHVMREVGRIRATHGLAVSRETAWRMAYLRKIGNPTIPIAVSSALVDRLVVPTTSARKPAAKEPAVEAEPSASSLKDSSALGVDVREHPVDWSDADKFEEVISSYWEEPPAMEPVAPSSAPTHPRKPARGGTSGGTEPSVTRAIPVGKRNREPPANRNSRARFPPTNAELAGPGKVNERVERYLARAERNGHQPGTLDVQYVAVQFRVSDRHIRNTIKTYTATKRK